MLRLASKTRRMIINLLVMFIGSVLARVATALAPHAAKKNNATRRHKMHTDPAEFKRFHEHLVENHPEYTPFYFPLNKESKDPVEGISWKQNRVTVEQACKYLLMGYNIGIAATDIDKLCIMDKDDIEAVGVTKPTLTVTSRKRIGEHGFYFTDDKTTSDIFEDSAKQNIATETYGEIRAKWQYVVCAGSFVPVTLEEKDDEGNNLWTKIPEEKRIDAGRYTVREARPVSTITYNELPNVYLKCLTEKREDELAKRLSVVKKENHSIQYDKNKSALFNLSIEDVTGKIENGKIENGGQRFPSLFHGSATGMNSSIKDGLFHCWRHSVSHSPLTALAVIVGLGECSRVGFAHHGRGASSIDLKDGETQFKLWEYAKKEGLIPQDDPIPSKALVYFALKEKLCVESDIVDGWKLPTAIYNITIKKLHEAGVIPGRQPFIPTINKTKPTKTTAESDTVEIDNNLYTDMRNSKRLVNKINGFAKYNTSQRAWMVYTGKKWELDTNGVMMRYARVVAKDIQHEALDIEDLDKRKFALGKALACESCARLESMVKLCQSEEGVCIEVNNLNTNIMLFNVQNGTLNLVTGKLQGHSELDLISNISPIKYDKDAKCPVFLNFLTTIMGENTEIIKYIQKLMGYCLTGDTMEKGFYVFHGTTDTGKSTLLELMLYIFGDYGASAETSLLLSNKFKSKSTNDLADLVGKRFVCASETEEGAALDEPRIKMLTSGLDSVRCRQLYERNTEYRPQYKIIVGTNSKPYIKGSDDAIWYRLHCAPFNVQIPKNDQDKKLPEKMKREAAGVLNWLVEGCLKWQSEGLNDPEDIRIHTSEYRASMDTIKVFLDEYYVKEKGNQHIIPNKEMYQKYRLSQISNGINENSIININTFITKVGNSGLFHKKIHRAEHWFNIREKTTTETQYVEEDRKQRPKRYEGPNPCESGESESKVPSNNNSLGKLDTGLTRLTRNDQPLVNLIPTDSGITQLCKEPVVVVDGLVAFFESYSRMVNPETFTDMKWRSMTAVNQLKVQLKMPQEQADKVWQDYCNQRNWPAPIPQLGNGPASPAPAPAPAPPVMEGSINSDATSDEKSFTDLTRQLMSYAPYYQRHGGVINSLNIAIFCKEFVRLNHPKAPDGSFYTLSAIEGIARNVFKITPAVETMVAVVTA
jgi:putative DNA primase/helicase